MRTAASCAPFPAAETAPRRGSSPTSSPFPAARGGSELSASLCGVPLLVGTWKVGRSYGGWTAENGSPVAMQPVGIRRQKQRSSAPTAGCSSVDLARMATG